MVIGPLENVGRIAPVLGVILAGGASRRYGQDKALALLGGVPLLQWVVDRLRPQVNELAISGETRPGFDLQAIPDELPDTGPLAALCSILAWAERKGFPLVMTASCDTPFVPRDICSVLHVSLANHDCAVASRGGPMHPTCVLWKTACRASIDTAFDAGVRSLHGAISYLNAIAVDFTAGDSPGGDPFFNINSQADMVVAQAWLAEGRRPIDGCRRRCV
jgi:molybdopterin-guanine dinucleotide biosynthesis protein A